MRASSPCSPKLMITVEKIVTRMRIAFTWPRKAKGLRQFRIPLQQKTSPLAKRNTKASVTTFRYNGKQTP